MSDIFTFEAVTDPRISIEAITRVEALVEKPDRLKPEALSARGWVAVPVESASHFNESDAELLTQAMNGARCKSCWAVVTDDIQSFPRVYQVAATSDGLLEFSVECSAFNVVLLPEEDDLFAVLCSVDDYFLVAGPPAFLASALPTSVTDARTAFVTMASEASWPPETRQKLIEVAKLYEGG